jgi:hypothetical protein
MTGKALRRVDWRNHKEVDLCLAAVVRCFGNYSQACDMLAENGINMNGTSLKKWVQGRHRERFLEIRAQLAPELERDVAQDMLSVAGRATRVNHTAIEKAYERLVAGKDEDPSRSAVNLARVAQLNTDKMLSLQGRPIEHRESRDVTEMLRALVGMGVLKVGEEPQVIDATAEEDAAA